MPIIMKIVHFAVNGARTFRHAARGHFRDESEAVRSIRAEMLSNPSSRFGDVQKMRHDRMRVGRDVRVSFNKIIADNG